MENGRLRELLHDSFKNNSLRKKVTYYYVLVLMKDFICFILIMTVSFSSCRNSSSYSPEDYIITNEDLALEKEYEEMLLPIKSLKVEEPKIYWFIVSWLNTQYKTPNWENYNTEDWKDKTKKRGIDCSGFARVMQDKIFNKNIRGGSKGILKSYCKKIDLDHLKMGDLVFFKSTGPHFVRINHVGVYLQDGYFVHATSSKSAAKGLGLKISSLDEKRWKREFVTGGAINKK